MACAETGCEKPVEVRGFCQSHYGKRWYRGEIERVRPRAGALEAFLEAHVGYDSPECLIWPFNVCSKGYGKIKFRGLQTPSNRAMCILAHGEPPFVGAEAAHDCGNPACVNPKHLYWATSTENNRDKSRHGTQVWGEQINTAKLTIEQVRFIRSSDLKGADLARKFGVSPNAISRLRLGRTWRRA